MTQRQITNHKSDNLLVLIGSTRVLPKIILKSGTLNIGEVILYICMLLINHLIWNRWSNILLFYICLNKKTAAWTAMTVTTHIVEDWRIQITPAKPPDFECSIIIVVCIAHASCFWNIYIRHLPYLLITYRTYVI